MCACIINYLTFLVFINNLPVFLRLNIACSWHPLKFFSQFDSINKSGPFCEWWQRWCIRLRHLSCVDHPAWAKALCFGYSLKNFRIGLAFPFHIQLGNLELESKMGNIIISPQRKQWNRPLRETSSLRVQSSPIICMEPGKYYFNFFFYLFTL